MKKTTLLLLLVSLALSAAYGADYTLSGNRYLRKYTAPQRSQVYMAEIDAQRIANSMCDVKWEATDATNACATTHVTTNLDWNVTNRDRIDAALFCAGHSGDEHTAYANAACYRIDFPDTGTLPMLTNLSLTVYSDPYNAYGARISVYASDSEAIPTDCATVRGDYAGAIVATGVAARVSRTVGSSSNWYPATSNLTLAASLQLKRHLYIFVLMENYAASHGNWLDGCSYIENRIRIRTSAKISGWDTGCDIAEPYATLYNLKDGHASDDDDGDGLSNYSEYLISEVFGLADLDPADPKSDGSCLDRYRKAGELYLGEVFADHDLVDDDWEGVRAGIASDGMACANRGVYDCGRDPDRDGWSNYAEYMAGTEPDDPLSHPVPCVSIHVAYCGARRETLNRLVVSAWNEADAGSADMTSLPDAEWIVEDVGLADSCDILLTAPTGTRNCIGHLREGASKFVVFADTDGDGAYTAGEPFGFVRGVDVGWRSASFSVSLTDTHPVFARINLTDGSCDRRYWSSMASTIGTNRGGTASAPSGNVRVRVIRTAVCGETPSSIGFTRRTVMDKTIDTAIRPYLHEGDFLSATSQDIDWTDLALERTRSGWSGDLTNVTYSIVFGEDTESNRFRYTVDRVFDCDAKTVQAVIEPYASVVAYNARPTFRWAVTSGGVNYNSYTTFRIEVLASDGTTVLYDSGNQAMPGYEVRDGINYYVWTAPPIVDSPHATGGRIGRNGTYRWRVTVYNAKFRYAASNPPTVSTLGTLTTCVNVTQDANDHECSAVPVAVKYAGPTNVLAKAANLGTLLGKVRVQAFATADYSGDPLSETVVTNGISATGAAANGKLCGLPAGPCYLRAYIDSNGNLERDEWESWGAAATAAEPGTATPVAIYIEDADTDDDWLPDAWEFAKADWDECNGWLAERGKDVAGMFRVTGSLYAAVTGATLTANISSNMTGSALAIFTYNTAADLVCGTNRLGFASVDDIRRSVVEPSE